MGNAARQLALLSLLAPGLAERLLARSVDRLHLQHDRTAYATNGNLFTPLPEGTTAIGGWKPRGKKRLLRAPAAGRACGWARGLHENCSGLGCGAGRRL